MTRINPDPVTFKHYGSFYDTTTQTSASLSVPTAVTINTSDISNGVTVNGSSIVFQNSGTYNLQFSIQFLGTKTATAELWLKKNGSNLAWTNSRFTISNQNPAVIGAANFFLPLVSNDVIQFYWATSDVDVKITSVSSGMYGSQIPGVIVTAVEI